MAGEKKARKPDRVTKTNRLIQPVSTDHDHFLGNQDAEITLVEYGSYFSASCFTAHEVVANLRDRFGDQLLYVYRHLPLPGHEQAKNAAILTEYASETSDNFWELHDALMKRKALNQQDFEEIAEDFNLPRPGTTGNGVLDKARQRVDKDVENARQSGAVIAPTFYINDRRYEGPWDESALAEAMVGSLGYRIQTAALDFVRWGPSSGIALTVMVLLALALANSSASPQFLAIWDMPFGFRVGETSFHLPLLRWINDGLLSIFFLVVGLEIKREFTVGRLANRRAAGLPLTAAFGGIVIPAFIYLVIAPAGPLSIGWGTTISTDTAFAIAIIAFMGDRVPVELRIFLTACAILDDLVSILVVAVFYTEEINLNYLVASVVITAILAGLNRWRIYRLIPYILLGLVLWFCIYASGVHATLAGVILALFIPTRPPANLRALNAQAQSIFKAEAYFGANRLMRHGPSQRAVQMLNTIHARIESPATKVLHAVEPWSSYFVLPVFAVANAGVLVTLDVFKTDLQLMMAIFFGLVVGKPVGIYLFGRLAVRLGIADKPDSYNWRQLFGAGALAGIGFTMSLFIASEAFPNPTDFAAAKIAIFIASIVAGVLGAIILWKKVET